MLYKLKKRLVMKDILSRLEGGCLNSEDKSLIFDLVMDRLPGIELEINDLIFANDGKRPVYAYEDVSYIHYDDWEVVIRFMSANGSLEENWLNGGICEYICVDEVKFDLDTFASELLEIKREKIIEKLLNY